MAFSVFTSVSTNAPICTAFVKLLCPTLPLRMRVTRGVVRNMVILMFLIDLYRDRVKLISYIISMSLINLPPFVALASLLKRVSEESVTHLNR